MYRGAQDGKSVSASEIVAYEIRFDWLAVLGVVEPSTPLRIDPE
jgi:hypothetical protein